VLEIAPVDRRLSAPGFKVETGREAAGPASSVRALCVAGGARPDLRSWVLELAEQIREARKAVTVTSTAVIWAM
jgi:hypothetical protein